jgi:hypothetical protein
MFMEQKTRRRLAFIGVGALMPIGGFLLAAACGTDNGTTDTPKNDSGRTDTSTSSSGGSSGGSSGSTSGDAAADCANVPNVKSSTGPFCFGVLDASPDGSTKNANCNAANKEVCCGDSKYADAAFAPSTCEVATVNAGGGYNEACNGKFIGATPGLEWQCTEKAHCPGTDEYCCLTGSDAGFPKPGENFDHKGCENAKFQSAKFIGGTRCRKTACQQGEQTLCASDADCKAGTCTFIEVGGRYTGYCRVASN